MTATKLSGLEHLAGRYCDVSVLGRGAQATVYRAYDTTLLKWVAIKVLTARNLSGAQFVSFQREARLLSRLNSPYLISVLDFGTGDTGRPYLIMDYIDGKPFSLFLLDKSSFSVLERLDIFIQICNGMQHAHEQGILHRDLKPSNILVHTADSTGSRVKIIDFGVADEAICAEQNENELTSDQSKTVGSPLYMAPEIIECKQAGRQSDVYAVGCMLYEAFCGRKPYVGASSLETMSMHCHAPIPDVEKNLLPYRNDSGELADGASLAAIITRCLAKDSSQRYAHMGALLEDLRSERNYLAGDAYSEPGFVDGTYKSGERRDKLHKPLLLVGSAFLFPLSIATFFVFSMVPGLSRVERSQTTSSESDSSVSSKLAAKTIAPEQMFKLEIRNGTTMWRAYREGDAPDAISSKCLRSTAINDESLRKLATMHHYDLNLSETAVTGRGFEYLSNWLPTKVMLNRSFLSDEGMKSLVKLKSIEELDLSETGITDVGLAQIVELPRLKKLRLRGCELITAKGLSGILKKCPALEDLNIANTRINPSIVSTIKNLRRLRVLDAQNLQFSDEDVSKLCDSGIQTLYLSENFLITDKSVDTIIASRNLLWACLDGCPEIGPQSIARLKSSGKLFKSDKQKNKNIEVNDFLDGFGADSLGRAL